MLLFSNPEPIIMPLMKAIYLVSGLVCCTNFIFPFQGTWDCLVATIQRSQHYMEFRDLASCPYAVLHSPKNQSSQTFKHDCHHRLSFSL